MHGATIKILMC